MLGICTKIISSSAQQWYLQQDLQQLQQQNIFGEEEDDDNDNDNENEDEDDDNDNEDEDEDDDNDNDDDRDIDQTPGMECSFLQSKRVM